MNFPLEEPIVKRIVSLQSRWVENQKLQIPRKHQSSFYLGSLHQPKGWQHRSDNIRASYPTWLSTKQIWAWMAQARSLPGSQQQLPEYEVPLLEPPVLPMTTSVKRVYRSPGRPWRITEKTKISPWLQDKPGKNFKYSWSLGKYLSIVERRIRSQNLMKIRIFPTCNGCHYLTCTHGDQHTSHRS